MGWSPTMTGGRELNSTPRGQRPAPATSRTVIGGTSLKGREGNILIQTVKLEWRLCVIRGAKLTSYLLNLNWELHRLLQPFPTHLPDMLSSPHSTFLSPQLLLNVSCNCRLDNANYTSFIL